MFYAYIVEGRYNCIREGKALDDNKIVGLYLLRDESAIIHTAEKYGKRIYASICCQLLLMLSE